MVDCRPPGSNTVKVPVAWYGAQEKESKKWVRAPLIALKPFQDRVVDLCQSQEFDEPVHVVSDHIIGDAVDHLIENALVIKVCSLIN